MEGRYKWGGQHQLLNPYGKLVIERVRLNSGGYTSAGRYFGVGAPLYRVMNDDSADGVVDFYIRAKDRAAAGREVRSIYPLAAFRGSGNKRTHAKRQRAYGSR